MSHLIAQGNMHTFFKETVTNVQVLVSQLNKSPGPGTEMAAHQHLA